MDPVLSAPLKLHLKCQECPVRHHAICRAIADSQLQKLSEIMIHRNFAPGQVIHIEEDEVSQYAIVMSGVVKLLKLLPDGRQQIVAFHFPADFIGRVFSMRTNTLVEAATEVELCCFPRKGFEAILHANPDLEHELFEKTLDDLDSAREWLLALGRKSAMEKVSSLLLQLLQRTIAAHCPNHNTLPEHLVLDLPLTRSEMADYLGLTVETVSRCMTKLKTQNIIKLQNNRKIEICDSVALEHMTATEN